MELNIIEQVKNLSKTTIIQKAWYNGEQVHLHGWVFGLHDGIIKPIIEMPPGTEVEGIYKYDFD